MDPSALPSSAGVTMIDHVAVAVPTGQLDSHVPLYDWLGFTV